jgi:transposase
MLPEDVDFEPARLDHLPLIRALITRLGIDEVLEQRLPKDPRNHVSDADCVTVMILNILHGRVALYQMERFLVHVDIEVLLGSGYEAGWFNDARLASALDHLFDAGVDSVMSDVVRHWLTKEWSGTSYSVHLDTTTLVLHGAYDVIPDEGAPAAHHGFSKDHRPDLKQLLFGLSLHGSRQMPLQMAMLDGNTSESKANGWHIEQLAELLPEEHEVTLVADSKLVDKYLMGQLLHEGFHFVSLMPATFQLHTELIEAVRTAEDEPPILVREPGRSKKAADRIYRGISFVRNVTVQPPDQEARAREMRLLVVGSDQLEAKFEATLQRKLAQEEQRLVTAVDRANQRAFACRADAEAARTEVLKLLELQNTAVTIVEEEQVEKRSKPGRPKKGEQPPSRTVYRLVLEEVVPNEDAIDKLAFHARHFVLITDHTEGWDDVRILTEYRHQTLLEGHTGFRWLKNEARVAPVFLHTPRRIAALGLVFVLALMVRNYLQFELRQRLVETKRTIAGRLGKPVDNPTAETALLPFEGLATVRLLREGVLLQRLRPKLPPDVLTILEVLRLPRDIYVLPHEKWPPLSQETSGM